MDTDKDKLRAKSNVYRLLFSRPRSEREVRDRLKMKGYSQALIDETVAGFKRSGEISDEKFARFWIEARMHANPMGDVVLRYELKEKGVAGDIIDAALKEKAASYDDFEVAYNMARDKYERFAKLDRRKAAKRVYDFLVRRGFDFDVVRRVMEKIAG